MQGLAKRVDWIKNLVLELIRAPIKEAAGDLNFQRNFKSMIQTVLGQHSAPHPSNMPAHDLLVLFEYAVAK